ncbi:MAG TPA: nucleotidyltransferase domain-containing protein [Leptospiraceae bacterium]|nr:nucleotidyltransferase domain-containing protein [Leptospiraceae bacterium]HNF14632.1 nucleotidyltransferase domain-containing protein [Leptospiraceae bacterium]HNH07363.1 nucleotidyltransferase domain-containing protein [Leptospiraceae bacterium]HNN04896.1 nucleotidyltransferase domain-containing protein [Leptospiraceae bacterium]HNO25444.1 nucleotidyltransferase domain-containing protein [Leptospiraceae bacterium]
MNTAKYLSEKEWEVIQLYKNYLLKNYSENIKNFYLFGSKARGDFREDSDIDILITLNDYNWRLGDEIRRVGYELDEEIDSKFSILVCSDSEFGNWMNKRYQFVENVMKEGVAI